MNLERAEMTGEELRADGLRNGFILDDSSLDGFENAAELRALLDSADISTPEKLAAFKRWEDQDGSKDGLLKLQIRQLDWQIGSSPLSEEIAS